MCTHHGRRDRCNISYQCFLAASRLWTDGKQAPGLSVVISGEGLARAFSDQPANLRGLVGIEVIRSFVLHQDIANFFALCGIWADKLEM